MELGRYALGNEIIKCTFFDFATGKPFLYMDYANTSQNEWTADQTYATGGSGSPRRVVFNNNKQSTLTLETQIFTMQHLAMVAGRNIESGIGKNIYKREVLTVTDNVDSLEITLSKTPIDADGNGVVDKDDVAVFKYVNGVDGAEVTVSSVDTTSKKVVLTGVTASEQVVVYYQWATTAEAHKLTFTADDFPKYIKIVGDTALTDELSGEIAFGQLVYYKAKLQPNFTLSANGFGDPTSISLVFDIFAHEINGKPVMADITLYDE